MPPLTTLRVFEAAVRLVSVREAARELGRSPNAVSHQIKLTEEFFGEKLFSRKGGKLNPTQAALALSKDLKTAFDLIAAASEKFAAGQSENTITINATRTFSLRWLIPYLAKFEMKYPEIKITLDTSTEDDINHLNQPYDFIFRKNHLRLRGHTFKRLMPDNATPVVSQKFLNRNPIHTPEDVLKYTLLHMKTRPIAWHIWLSEFASLNSDVVPGIFYDHYYLSIEAALNGQGLALIPLYLINEELASGRLIAPLPSRYVIGFGMYVTYRKNVTQFPHKALLLNYLFKCADQTQAEAWIPKSAPSANTETLEISDQS